MIWEQKVNSKKNETKNLTKTDPLSKYIHNALQILLVDKLWKMLLSEILRR